MKATDELKKTPFELFEAIDRHLTGDERPSEYLGEIIDEPAFEKAPFSMLKELRRTEQSPRFHPEGNVWNHTLMVVDEAARRRGESSDPRALMWAALLHDIGKPPTSVVKDGRIKSYDHDREGAKLAERFLRAFSEDEGFIRRVVYLVRHHMQALYVSKRRDMLDIESIRSKGDFHELALLCLSDRLGRLGADRESEARQIDLFMRICEEKERA